MGARTLVFSFLCLACAGGQITQPQAPRLPIGFLRDGLYVNESLGLRLPIPTGWNSELSQGSNGLVDPVHPDSPLNRCSQVLVSMEKTNGGTRFRSSEAVMVINPVCFDKVVFPSSYEARDQIAAFVQCMVKIFHGTVYIPPSGVDFDEEHTPQHLFVRMLGYGFRSADGQEGGKQIHTNTLITVTASGAYWIVWASLTDDAARDQLKKTKFQIREE